MPDDTSIQALTYTLSQAAKALGMSRTTLSALVNRGDIPCLFIGSRRLVSRKALADWVADPNGRRVAGRGDRPSEVAS